jgi:hypothetical protein
MLRSSIHPKRIHGSDATVHKCLSPGLWIGDLWLIAAQGYSTNIFTGPYLTSFGPIVHFNISVFCNYGKFQSRVQNASCCGQGI